MVNRYIVTEDNGKVIDIAPADKFQNKYRSRFMEMADRKLKNDLIKLNRQLKDIDYCVIGGVAVKEYGYNRTTEDIDILVKKSDEQEIYKRFGTYDLEGLVFNGIGVDVLFSGERMKKQGMNYPIPKNVKEEHYDVPFIDLWHLVVYKLDAGRLQDLADVEQLIIKNQLPNDYIDNLDNQFTDLVEKYNEIWNNLQEK